MGCSVNGTGVNGSGILTWAASSRQPGHHERREQAHAAIECGGADDGVEQRAGGFEPGGTNGHWLQILAYAYCTDNRRQ